MTTATLLELADRVEKATGPDRELDRLIEETRPGVLEHPDTHRFVGERLRVPYVISGHGHAIHEPGQGYIPPRYTASLDAAMTLVPEGFNWACGTNAGEPENKPWAWCDKQLGELPDDYLKFAATPALALVAASLRALAQPGGDN